MKESKLSAVDNWCVLAEQAGFKPAALANLLGVSLRALELFIRHRTRHSLHDWLNELRLRLAAQRLAGGAPIDGVARELGFCNRSHFHNRFHAFFGHTPGEFVIKWKRREAERITQGGSASASAPPSRELAAAVQALEAQLRGDRAPLSTEPAGKTVRIALVDDDANVQGTVQEAFSLSAPDWQLESHSPSKEVVQRLAQEPPAVVLLGCRRPKKSRIDYLAMLAVCLPSLPIILFAASSDGDEILSALAAGAVGYVLKSAPSHQLVQAVRQVLQEGASLCQQAQKAVLDYLHGKRGAASKARLTPREREICVLLLNHIKKEVAVKLNLETKTVDALAQRAFKNLGIHRREELPGALARLD